MPARKRARRGDYSYQQATGRYRDAATGRFVPQTQVRRALERRVEAAGREMRTLATQLRDGQITTRAWREAMRTQIRDVHLYSAATARGGWQQLSAADFGRVGARVKSQLRFLDKFAGQIESGLPLDGRFTQRSGLYSLAGKETAFRVQTLEMSTRGFDEERSIRSPVESCPTCISEEARGWVPIGTLIPIGSRDCLGNDRCRREVRNTSTGAVQAA